MFWAGPAGRRPGKAEDLQKGVFPGLDCEDVTWEMGGLGFPLPQSEICRKCTKWMDVWMDSQLPRHVNSHTDC